jgi:hypothetical protein
MKNPEELVKETLELINKKLQTENEIIEYISLLLYSIGGSIEKRNPSTSEEVMANFYNKPSLGKALMAQALIFRDKWNRKEI